MCAMGGFREKTAASHTHADAAAAACAHGGDPSLSAPEKDNAEKFDKKFLQFKAQKNLTMRAGALTLRLLGEGDAAALTQWLSDVRVLAFYEGRDRAHTPEMVRTHFYRADGVLRMMALLDGARVGYLQMVPLSEEERAAYGCGEVRACGLDLFIGEPELWGKGLGRRMVAAALSWLFDVCGAQAAYLDPREENVRAIRCYKACGFVCKKRLPAHEMHEGALRDCVLMECTPERIKRAELPHFYPLS